MSTLEQSSTKINDANKGQISQALVVQSYCLSVLQQPPVDFQGQTRLKKQQDEVNVCLAKAQTHARTYLNDIQPKMIQNVTNIDSYFKLQGLIPKVLLEGATAKDWVDDLTAVLEEAKKYKAYAEETEKALGELVNSLDTDVTEFASVVQSLNEIVKGDNSILNSNKKSLEEIQGKIDDAILTDIVSGISIGAGSLITVVGAVLSVVTGGASTALIAGGFVLVAGGIGGLVTGESSLESLNKRKAQIIFEDVALSSEVKLAMGISSAYSSLKKNAANAVEAASKMKSAWQFLADDLTHLIENVKKATPSGKDESTSLRELFLAAAEKSAQSVLADTSIIKKQVAGVKIVIASDGESITDALSKEMETVSKPASLMNTSLSFAVKDLKIVPRMNTSTSRLGDVVTEMSSRNTKQAAAGAVMQAYATSVLQQAEVSFNSSQTPQLATFQTRINSGLNAAKGHASRYINEVQPRMIRNVSNITDFFNLQSCVASTLPSGQAMEVWLAALSTLGTKSRQYQEEANETLSTIKDLQGHLRNDSTVFSSIVWEVNDVANGDKGLIAKLQREIESLNSKLDKQFANAVVSYLKALGGIIMIVVGATSKTVPVVVGGISIAASGVSGITAVSTATQSSLEKRDSLLSAEMNLKEEVLIALAISTGYESLNKQVQGAIDAASEMATAWESLTTYLGDLEQALRDSTLTADSVQKQFLMTANNEVKDILLDTSNIRAHMTGIKLKTAESSTVPITSMVEVEQDGTRTRALPASIIQPRGLSMFSSMFVSLSITKGNLSSALSNFNKAVHRAGSQTGLPSDADDLRKLIIPFGPTVSSSVSDLQSGVQAFCSKFVPVIENSVDSLRSGTKPSDSTIKTPIGQMLKQVDILRVSVGDKLAVIEKVSQKLVELKKQLAPIQSNLDFQKIQLQTKADTAQKKYKEAESNYYYLLALGPFGLVGLAAALVLYLTTKSEVDNLERQVFNAKKLKGMVEEMSRSTNELGGTDVKGLSDEIDADSSVVMQTKLLQAKQEMLSLAKDAM